MNWLKRLRGQKPQGQNVTLTFTTEEWAAMEVALERMLVDFASRAHPIGNEQDKAELTERMRQIADLVGRIGSARVPAHATTGCEGCNGIMAEAAKAGVSLREYMTPEVKVQMVPNPFHKGNKGKERQVLVIPPNNGGPNQWN